ncbi:hypothetical protein T03_1709 [Trichinella britovi]|uniref:Uncharacterized protein n=1 Tax=Trichinella britovi TaxID=45882 RepID=A0A0V0YUI7_TRIBR|nr:hypothetical protein T03_1709 [Trichinella britovi]
MENNGIAIQRAPVQTPAKLHSLRDCATKPIF